VPMMLPDVETLAITALAFFFGNLGPWLIACAFIYLTHSEIKRCIHRFLD